MHVSTSFGIDPLPASAAVVPRDEYRRPGIVKE